MAGKKTNQGNGEIFSHDDALDINELASLNEDFSPDFLEQLQNQLVQQNGLAQASNTSDDTQLFEEVPTVDTSDANTSTDVQEEVTDTSQTEPTTVEKTENIENTENTPNISDESKAEKSIKRTLDDSIDDNFIKKYKAKLKKQQLGVGEDAQSEAKPKKSKFAAFENKDIETLTGGNIIEKPVVKEQIAYNDSLDLLDENVKYSKYVIYIDPENTEFIESLTVKERKNLINKILREQDDIMMTKRRFTTVQAVIKHTIIAIITVAIAIPIIYVTVNASLEASIDNYRRSKSMFKTLYKERGKIKSQQSYHH